MPYKDPEVRKRKHAEYSRSYYLANKDKVKAATVGANKRNKEIWDTFKKTLQCTKCGFAHPAALDFHHEDPEQKEYNVHKLVSNKRFAKAYEEIKKCTVLCANCHRIHHYNEKNPAL
jgi:hypothetical protein